MNVRPAFLSHDDRERIIQESISELCDDIRLKGIERSHVDASTREKNNVECQGVIAEAGILTDELSNEITNVVADQNNKANEMAKIRIQNDMLSACNFVELFAIKFNPYLRRMPGFDKEYRDSDIKPLEIRMKDVPVNRVIIEYPKSSKEFWIIECPICDKSFEILRELYYHIQGAHSGIITGAKLYSHALDIGGTRVIDTDREWMRIHNETCKMHKNTMHIKCRKRFEQLQQEKENERLEQERKERDLENGRQAAFGRRNIANGSNGGTANAAGGANGNATSTAAVAANVNAAPTSAVTTNMNAASTAADASNGDNEANDADATNDTDETNGDEEANGADKASGTDETHDTDKEMADYDPNEASNAVEEANDTEEAVATQDTNGESNITEEVIADGLVKSDETEGHEATEVANDTNMATEDANDTPMATEAANDTPVAIAIPKTNEEPNMTKEANGTDERIATPKTNVQSNTTQEVNSTDEATTTQKTNGESNELHEVNGANEEVVTQNINGESNMTQEVNGAGEAIATKEANGESNTAQQANTGEANTQTTMAEVAAAGIAKTDDETNTPNEEPFDKMDIDTATQVY